MSIRLNHIAIIATICCLCSGVLSAQETVFSGLKSSLKRADRYFDKQHYQDALELYLDAERRGKGSNEINLKIARSYHALNYPEQAVQWYDNYLSFNPSLDMEDSNNYAISLISQGQYERAIEWLKKKHPGSEVSDQEIIEKIWRLQNIKHLYTDSSFYAVHRVEFNTNYSEYGPAYLDGGLAFTSNRKDKGGISKMDPITNHPYQMLYYVDCTYDSTQQRHVFGKPKSILKDQSGKLHQGTIAANDSLLIFTRSDIVKTNGESRLQLFWAQSISGTWKGEAPFKYNSDDYSASYPALSRDGKTLIFVSDMPGGFGGTDLYRCVWEETGWSSPENLGVIINTAKNETAPFLHQNHWLYFASNGHAGLGGLDIFKVSLNQTDQVQNLGYPVNTPSDDFGLIINESGANGFFASNRATSGFDDDIYEVQIDLQQYPLTITGVIKYNDPVWSTPDRTELLSNARLYLIDHLIDKTVYETTSDDRGAFSMEIPYSSKFRIDIIDDRVGQPSVSLEFQKNRRLHTSHEIVVMKEKFQKTRKSSRSKLSSMKNPGEDKQINDK